MLVIGLHGWLLPEPLIILCDWFVYAEFIFNPLQLLTSPDLRDEIVKKPFSTFMVFFVASI